MEITSRKLGQQNHRACRLFLRLDVSVPTNLRKIKLIFREEWRSCERQKSQAQTVPFGPSDSSCFHCLQPTPAKIVKFAFESSCLECCTAHGDPVAQTHSRKEEAPALANPRVPSARQSPSEKGRSIFSQEPYAKGTSTQSITGCLGAGGMYTPSMSLSLQIVSFPFSTNESLPANCVCVPMRVLWTVGIRKRY